MYKRLLVVLCWLAVGSSVSAQEDTATVIMPENEFYLKINPLVWAEIEGGIAIAGEYILVKPKLGLQLELQPILYSAYKNYDYEEPSNTLTSGNPLGIKLRPEVRYYLDGLRSKKYHRRIVLRADGTPMPYKSDLRGYVAVDCLYKYVWRQRLGELEVNNSGTTPGYRQRAIYTDIKKITGFDIKFGLVSSISKSNRWMIEAFAGIGFRHKKFSYKNLPVGISEPPRGASARLFSNGVVPRNLSNIRDGSSLPAGIKLVYRL